MATTNLFAHPVFRDGAFTSSDAAVRAFALQKTMRAIDLGAELGARIYVFWGGREGTETDAYRDPRDALKYFRDAINFLCEYANDQGYDMRFALEPKPNEPRGDMYLPTVGHALHFISTLAHPEMIGVNPEFAHETMAGLNFVHAVGQALEAGKLFHIDLNDQVVGNMTRTSASPRRTRNEPSSWSSCWRRVATMVRGTSTRTPTGQRMNRGRTSFRCRLRALLSHPERKGGSFPRR